MEESRKLFFDDLKRTLLGLAVDPAKDVRSVFEVGCSLGYQLRYAETSLFPAGERFAGMDIDRYAVDSGTAYLRSLGSKVHLICGDMEELEEFLRDDAYDIVMCSGVLMYLEQDAAARVVERMLRHTNVLAAFAGLAAPGLDNALLQESEVRRRDHTFIHNIDAMVRAANGTVVARRWEGERMVDGHTLYFVFAAR
jgi:SAM-dependent methyltransferase